MSLKILYKLESVLMELLSTGHHGPRFTMQEKPMAKLVTTNYKAKTPRLDYQITSASLKIKCPIYSTKRRRFKQNYQIINAPSQKNDAFIRSVVANITG